MTDFLQRLHECNRVQWMRACVAAALALIQVLHIVAQRFGGPEYFVRFIIIGLTIGFLATLTRSLSRRCATIRASRR